MTKGYIHQGALFIGRFQPFHLGHLDAIRQILKKHRRILIGIGSAEESFTRENPFTARERFQMIEAALKEAGVSKERYDIIPLRDIKQNRKWVKHIESLTPPFYCVYTGSALVKKLFKKAGYGVQTQKFNLKISATEVRKAMLRKHPWQSFVPRAVAKLLTIWRAEARIQNS